MLVDRGIEFNHMRGTNKYGFLANRCVGLAMGKTFFSSRYNWCEEPRIQVEVIKRVRVVKEYIFKYINMKIIDLPYFDVCATREDH